MVVQSRGVSLISNFVPQRNMVGKLSAAEISITTSKSRKLSVPLESLVLDDHAVKAYLQAGTRSARLSILDPSRNTVTPFTSPHYTRLRCKPKIVASLAV